MATISVTGATSVTTSTTSVYDVLNGGTLTVNSGGSISSAIVANGGVVSVLGGGVDNSATIQSGGSEMVFGSVVGDIISGTQTLSSAGATATNETVVSGGNLDLFLKGSIANGTTVDSGGAIQINGSAYASNTTLIGGGLIELESTQAYLSGTVTFSGSGNEIELTKVLTGALATASFSLVDFAAGDTIVVSGATSASVAAGTGANAGNAVATVSSGASVDTFILSNTAVGAVSWALSGGTETLTYGAGGGGGVTSTISTGTSTGLSVSSGETLSVVSGGAVVSTNVVNGGALVISGGVDSLATISSGVAETIIAGGSATGDQIYGSAYTAASGSAVLTSETVEAGGNLLLANGNTANNTTVLSGGVFNVSGANFAANNTTLNGGGVLDLQSPKAVIGGSLTFAGGNNNLEVTGIASAPVSSAGVTTSYGDLAVISGFSTTDKIELAVVSAGATLSFQSNSDGTETVTLNGTSGVSAVSEAFIFNSASLYNAFTVLSQTDTTAGGGVDIVYNPNATTHTVSSGTVSNLIVSSGETLTVAVGATVSATTVQSGGVFLVSGSDFGATMSGAETVFGTASGDKIFGATIVSGAISAATVNSGATLTINGATAFGTSDTIVAGGSEILTNGGSTSGDVVSGTATLSGAGDTITSATIANSGLVTINIGAVDNGATILSGGNETVFGSANGDKIFGAQLVSYATAVVTSETVENGGSLDLFLKGGVASATTVLSGGALNVNGYAYASNTVLSGGGLLDLQSPKAEATGSLTFEGGFNVLKIDGVTSAGFGAWAAVISGFSQTDKIDITSSAFVDSGLSLSQTVSGGNTLATVVSGGTVLESFTFAGTALDNDLSLVTDGAGGAYLEITPLPVTTSVTTSTASGAYNVTGPNELLVLAGGSISAATVQSGASLVISGGVDAGALVQAGGVETLSAGSAGGDQISGSAVVSGGVASSESVFGGATLNVVGGSANNTILDGGAVLDLSTPTATVSGSLTFANGSNQLLAAAIAGNGAGDLAVISGFSTSDKIDVSGISPTGASLTFAANGDGTETATIANGALSESFIFANSTYNANTLTLMKDGSGGVDLVLKTTPVVAFTSLSGLQSNTLAQVVNGTVNVGVDPEAVGSTVTIKEGATVVGAAIVQANGYWTSNVTLLNGNGANVLTASVTDGAGQTGTTATPLTTNVNTSAAAFTPGNLVISVYGDGSGSGNYTLDQAAPITLDQITTSGTIVSQTVLPETTTNSNGVTENAISGEYGSASEGVLQLSADGHSLTIFGYGVNYQAFDASNGASIYGNAALGQSTSLTSATVTVVPRVVADINASGAIDTSTSLTNIYSSNNPRSIATVNGTAFWLSGQGVKGSTNQGVFYATDGATAATALNTASDTREAVIYNGQLYISADSTQGVTNIADYGALPTSATTPVVLKGIGPTVTLNGANGNAANGSTGTVYLSPQSFFFANATTLYVADSGVPKDGGIGDGGLQKWSDVNGTWTLDYTLTAGLNLQANTGASGVAGLYGLTGEVVNGNVELFATSSTIGELDTSYLYSIADPLASTTGAGETFATVMTAAPDTIIRGVSFTPTGGAETFTAAQVSANIDTLAASGTVTSITLTDPSDAINLTNTQFNADDSLLTNILGAAELNVTGVTGDGNLTSFHLFQFNGAQVGIDEFFTGLTGQNYTGDEIDYNGANQLTRAVYTGVTGAPYSSFEYDYVGGVLSGAQYTFAGAGSSSYVIDESAQNTFTGAKFFTTGVTGQSYTGEEVDYDANFALSRIVLTGMQNLGYASLELDYAAGAPSGYKEFYTGVTGQSYTAEEVDVSATNLVQKVIYSGITGAAYSSVEQDYAQGAASTSVFTFTNVSSSNFSSYSVTEDKTGAALQETINFTSGAHGLYALTGGQTLASQGLDVMTGSASGSTTFLFNGVYGADTITNFNANDSVSLSVTEFAQLATAIQNGNYAGGNAALSFSNGDTLTFDNMSKTTLSGLTGSFTSHT